MPMRPRSGRHCVVRHRIASPVHGLKNQQHRMPVGGAMQSLQVAQRINLLGQKFFIAMLGLAGCVLPWWATSGD